MVSFYCSSFTGLSQVSQKSLTSLTMTAQLQVYVFRGVFAEHTAGIAFAIANTEKEAKDQLIRAFIEDRGAEANRDRMIQDLYTKYGGDGVKNKLKQLSGKTYEEWIAEFPSPRNPLGTWRGNTEAFRKELNRVKPEVHPLQKLAFFVGGGSS